MPTALDVAGQRFHRLVAIEKAKPRNKRRAANADSYPSA